MRFLTIACVATAFAAAIPLEPRQDDNAMVNALSSGGSAKGGSVSSGSKSSGSSSSSSGSKNSGSSSGSKSSGSSSKGSSSSGWKSSGTKPKAVGGAAGAAAGAGLVCVANNNTVDPNALNITNGSFVMNCTQAPTNNALGSNIPGRGVAYTSAALLAAAFLALL